MKRQQKRIVFRQKYSDISQVEENDHAIASLKNAWENLPYDMSQDEREVFFEIAEELVKFNQKIRKQYKKDLELMKN